MNLIGFYNKYHERISTFKEFLFWEAVLKRYISMKALTVKNFSYNPAASENFTTLDKKLVVEEYEFTFTFAQKSIDNIFKMASLSVKRSIK